MKKFNVFIIVIIVITVVQALAGCSYNSAADRSSKEDDSVTFAQYRVYKYDTSDFYGDHHKKIEVAYIDTTDNNAYQLGDTIEVNRFGRIPAYTSEPDTAGWHWVILVKRTGNKKFSRDVAEAQQ